MIFIRLTLTEDGQVIGSAEGHATEVIMNFRNACNILLGTRGPWRLTEVSGKCSENDLDDGMKWHLEAQTKV